MLEIGKDTSATGSVVAMKLVSGEEIVCKVVSETPETITVTGVLRLVVEAGAAIPYMGSCQRGEMTFSKSHIVTRVQPDTEVSKMYQNQAAKNAGIQPAGMADLSALMQK